MKQKIVAVVAIPDRSHTPAEIAQATLEHLGWGKPGEIAALRSQLAQAREALEAEERVPFSIGSHDIGVGHLYKGDGAKNGCRKCIADELRRAALSPPSSSDEAPTRCHLHAQPDRECSICGVVANSPPSPASSGVAEETKR